MKINFYLHLRTFMIGTIVTISAAILLTSLPEIESSIFEDILDEDNGLYMLILSFGFIFFSYGIGMLLEIISNPYPRPTYLIKHLDNYLGFFSHADSIVQNSEAYNALNRNDTKRGIGNLKVYQYMFTYIISRNDNLNREIQERLFKIYTMFSLLIAMFLLLLTFLIQLLSADIDYSDAWTFNIIMVVLLIMGLILIYRVWQRSKIGLLDEIEQAYYVLVSQNLSAE